MRKLILTALAPVLCLLVLNGKAGTRFTDSSRINHVTDGNIGEWKADKFETDKETAIQYAVDHDAANLYLALKVSSMQVQMKLMTRGMNLYIDRKGKHREGTGIEFPVKKEGGGFNGGMRGQRNGGTERGENAGGPPDPKEMREKLASGMILLKTFGFDDQEDKTQLISQPNGVNVAFDWDEANNFYIEYAVPISLLGQTAALNGKPLGIGWKINGVEMPSASGSSFGAVPGGNTGRGGGGTRGGGGRGSSSVTSVDFNSNDSRFKEQSFWTKYILTL